MKNKLGVLCMTLGIVLIMAALSLFIRNRMEDNEAGMRAEHVVSQLESQVGTNGYNNLNGIIPDPYDTEMTEVEIDGDTYIGYVIISDLGLKLPVMSDWSYSQLKTAPCRYSGSTKTNDLVIMAHNYRRHFGMLEDLSIGDSISFIDMDGVLTKYEVETFDLLNPVAVEEMIAGEYDFTLFTCTYSGESRVTVRCTRVSD